jgi:non-ribosomal peptide synthetase component F
MVLLTAFKAVLRRLCGQDDIAVGTPVANRGSGDLEETVGFFVNTLVLRTGLGGDPTFREALGRVKRTCLDAYEHQDVPFGQLVDIMEAGRDPSRSPLFNIMFVLRHLDGEESLDLPGCTAAVIPVTYDTAKFDMAFELNESPGKLAGEIEYNTDLYTAQTAGRVAACFEKMLRECSRDPEARPGDVEILDAAEKEEILSGFNATGAPFPASTLHVLFREQARRTPDSIALVLGQEKMTYGELDRASDAAAAHLVSALADCSAADTIIGLPAIPEAGSIVCMLGILKAGCAYLPLEEGYPPERLAFMLEDGGAKALLLSGQVTGNLAESLSVLKNRGNDIQIVRTSSEPGGAVPKEDGDPRSLAYLMYTSGSTGEPKGVLVEHLGVSNLVIAQRQFFEIDASSKVLQFAPLGFDASVSEIFTALLSGAELHLTGADVRQDADRLVELMDKSGITTATLPPALLAVLPHKRLPALETLVVAGDRCDEETCTSGGTGTARRTQAGR